MDSIKRERLITENMKAIFGFALTRLGNVQRAEELASDIIFELVKSLPNLKDDERFYGFMWKIAENTYSDYLRKKSKNAEKCSELEENTASCEPLPEDVIVQNEELNLLRRELSLLSEQYRNAVVLYYMEKLSCSDVAKKLKTSTEMVKYYLFRARNIVREGMNMERLYGEKSYRPMVFEIDFWGTKCGDDAEYRDFSERKIKGNILLAAYYAPVTLQELSIELGVSVPYLEDEINILIKKQELIYKNGKYLTNIPIFTLDTTKTIEGRLRELTKASAEEFISVCGEFEELFRGRFKNENLMRWQKTLMCLHFSLIDTANDLEKTYGELPSDGPYSLINGGGGKGVIWGRCTESVVGEKLPQGIQGIYNGSPSSNKSGSVIAMNFRQTLNAQNFCTNMTDAIVSTALGEFENLSSKWQNNLENTGYAENGKANFTVWSEEEYRLLRKILAKSTAIISNLNAKAHETAAKITADLAPAHIRKTAEYVGALVYRFNTSENFVNALYNMNWLLETDVKEKPAMCVVTNN